MNVASASTLVLSFVAVGAANAASVQRAATYYGQDIYSQACMMSIVPAKDWHSQVNGYKGGKGEETPDQDVGQDDVGQDDVGQDPGQVGQHPRFQNSDVVAYGMRGPHNTAINAGNGRALPNMVVREVDASRFFVSYRGEAMTPDRNGMRSNLHTVTLRYEVVGNQLDLLSATHQVNRHEDGASRKTFSCFVRSPYNFAK